MRGLRKAGLRRRPASSLPRPAPRVFGVDGAAGRGFGAGRARGRAQGSDKPVTVRTLFARLNAFLRPTTTVVADVGDALFGAADLFLHHHTEFLAPAYYTSMGFAIPAAVGAQLARPSSRPLVLVGDGAFLMTGLELATIVRYQLNPIVVVLNNRGYGTERPMQDGPFNDLPALHHHRFPELLGAGRGFVVHTERDLNAALIAAEQHTETFCLIEVRLDPHDRSPALQRLTARMAKSI